MKTAILSVLCLVSTSTAVYFWNVDRERQAAEELAAPLIVSDLAALSPAIFEPIPADSIDAAPFTHTEKLTAAMATLRRAGYGDPAAQYDAAMLFLDGEVFPPSTYFAAEWLALAASNGSPRALAFLADCQCKEDQPGPLDGLLALDSPE